MVKEGAGYGGYTDRAIDIRVDDHAEPFRELGRLLNYAQMNYAWNEAWTLYTQADYTAALPLMEQTAKLGAENPEVLYDLTLIRLAAGDVNGALGALKKAVRINPKLRKQASEDPALDALRENQEFIKLLK